MMNSSLNQEPKKTSALFARVEAFVEKLLLQGTDRVGTDPELIAAVRHANFNGVMFFVLDIFLAGLFYLVLDTHYLSVALVVSALLFIVGSVGFNSMGWTTLSRVSTVSIGSFLVCFCAFYLGAESLAACSLLLGAVFPFIYFSSREKWAISICLSVPVLCYALLVFMDYEFGPRVQFQSEGAKRAIQFIFFLVPLVGVAANARKAVLARDAKNRELAESKHQLEVVFHALSHDLATPLQTVAFLSKVASEGRFAEKHIPRLQGASDQTMRIFKNLIKISQLTSQKSKLQMETCSLREALQEAVEFADGIASKKQIRIELLPSEDAKVVIEREAFIFQVITNFLTNAVKFSKENDLIQIRVQHLPMGRVCVTIVDHGQGIEPHRIPNLFSWRMQTSTTGTLGEKGTGHGLPLAKKFLDAMGGEIEVVSRTVEMDPVHHGSEVRIILLTASA